MESWEKSVGGLKGRSALGSLVVRKKPAVTVTSQQPAAETQAGKGGASKTFFPQLFVLLRKTIIQIILGYYSYKSSRS